MFSTVGQCKWSTISICQQITVFTSNLMNSERSSPKRIELSMHTFRFPSLIPQKNTITNLECSLFGFCNIPYSCRTKITRNIVKQLADNLLFQLSVCVTCVLCSLDSQYNLRVMLKSCSYDTRNIDKQLFFNPKPCCCINLICFGGVCLIPKRV